MGNVQFGYSDHYSKKVWAFEMQEGYKALIGEFAIMPKHEYLLLLSKIKNLESEKVMQTSNCMKIPKCSIQCSECYSVQ